MLKDLEVAGTNSGLYPPFSSGAQRFSVHAAPDQGISITATVEGDGRIAINGTPAQSGVSLSLPDAVVGDSIEVEVSNGGGVQRYSVIILPEDFPEIEVREHRAGASTDPIYVTLVSPEKASSETRPRFVAKLDNNGVPFFFRRGQGGIFDFKKHPGGLMSFAQAAVGLAGAEQIILDGDFQEIDRVRAVGNTQTDYHEFHILDNGDYLFLSYEPTVHDLTATGGPADQLLEDGILQRVSPAMEVLWQWNSFDHMLWTEMVYDHSETEYAHLNSVAVDAQGNWIVSARAFSQILKLDGVTGEVIWRLGGVSNDFEFINDPYGPCGQHTASVLDNGNLLIFDNGQWCVPESEERGERTRVVEYELDEEAMTATLVWSYERDGHYALSQGSAQRLANGNTFIGWGSVKSTLATEVDAEGRIVFDMAASDFISYRAWRFAD